MFIDFRPYPLSGYGVEPAWAGSRATAPAPTDKPQASASGFGVHGRLAASENINLPIGLQSVGADVYLSLQAPIRTTILPPFRVSNLPRHARFLLCGATSGAIRP